MPERTIEIKGVAVLFEFSVSINTVTTKKPTEFAKNYLKTLGDMAVKQLSKQVGEAMVERINEDFHKYPSDEIWEQGGEA